MAKRLVMKTHSEKLYFGDLKKYMEIAARNGVANSEPISVHYDEKGTEVSFGIPIPDNSVKKTKTQTAVDKQIEDHKKKKASGKKEAYVAPVVKRRPVKTKCPVCDVAKKVITVSGRKVLAPHVSKGEPCEGSGTEVAK